MSYRPPLSNSSYPASTSTGKSYPPFPHSQLPLICPLLPFSTSLLGISAFAGFTSMIIVIPFSQYLAKQVMKINKAMLAAKDERMKVVDEMFGAIKFIKFFAWEEQWIAKIVAKRMVEMKWLSKCEGLSDRHLSSFWC